MCVVRTTPPSPTVQIQSNQFNPPQTVTKEHLKFVSFRIIEDPDFGPIKLPPGVNAGK